MLGSSNILILKLSVIFMLQFCVFLNHIYVSVLAMSSIIKDGQISVKLIINAFDKAG